MFNVETSVYNSTLLGSGGELKYVRMASSVTCEAVQTRGVLTVGAPRFQLRGYAAASSNVKLYKARSLASNASAQATSSLSFTERKLSRFGSVAYASSSGAANLRQIRRNYFLPVGYAQASGLVLLVAKGALRGSFSASATSSSRLSSRRLRGVVANGICFTERFGKIYSLKALSSSLTCTASGSSVFANNSMDAVPDRTMYVGDDSRLMIVAGAR